MIDVLVNEKWLIVVRNIQVPDVPGFLYLSSPNLSPDFNLTIKSKLRLAWEIISELMMSTVSIEEHEAMNRDGNHLDSVSNIHYLRLSQSLTLSSNDCQTQPPGRRMRLSRIAHVSIPLNTTKLSIRTMSSL